jgi:oxaloacetate decarboxylase (Na+ extruding) subunit gamma
MNGLLLEGVRLMLLGMGSVFMFLMMLVFSMKLMSLLAQLLAPAEPHPDTPQSQLPTADANLVAVISAAVAVYRGRRG